MKKEICASSGIQPRYSGCPARSPVTVLIELCRLMVVACSFLGAFRKIAKSEYYLNHVCPSVCLSTWNNSAPTERIFMKFDILVFFEKTLQMVKVSLNSGTNNG
jgi:hypothetical protein